MASRGRASSTDVQSRKRTRRFILVIFATKNAVWKNVCMILYFHRRTGLQNLGGGGGADVSPPDERGTRENS